MIEGFAEGIRHILQTHPDTREDSIEVVLHDLGPNSLSILVKFFLKVPDGAAELIMDREHNLLDILRLAAARGVRFAVPTQTLNIESLPVEGQSSSPNTGD